MCMGCVCCSQMVQLLNSYLRLQLDEFPALAAIPTKEINALAELYVEEKQYTVSRSTKQAAGSGDRDARPPIERLPLLTG